MIFFNIFKRDIVNIVMNPTLFLINTVFPIMLVLVLGYFSGGGYGSETITSYDYYGITILIFNVLNVSMTSSNSFMEKSIRLSNLRIMFAPINKSYIYLSKILATLFFTSFCFLIYIVICKSIIGVDFGGNRIIYILIIMFAFNFFSSTIGVLFCCIFKGEELANTILSPINNIFSLLGGTFFPLDGFGKVIQYISDVSPVKWISTVSFEIIYDNNISYAMPLVFVLLCITLMLLILCKFTFNMEDYV